MRAQPNAFNAWRRAYPNRPSISSFDFKGRFIVSISDADMVPSAYSDGKLGPIDGSDALSIIRLEKQWG